MHYRGWLAKGVLDGLDGGERRKRPQRCQLWVEWGLRGLKSSVPSTEKGFLGHKCADLGRMRHLITGTSKGKGLFQSECDWDIDGADRCSCNPWCRDEMEAAPQATACIPALLCHHIPGGTFWWAKDDGIIEWFGLERISKKAHGCVGWLCAGCLLEVAMVPHIPHSVTALARSSSVLGAPGCQHRASSNLSPLSDLTISFLAR